MKKLFLVLATLTFGTSIAVACPGSAMKNADASKPVPQQSKPAPQS